MPEEEHIDVDYFADVDFDLTFPEICTVLERVDGTVEDYEVASASGTREYAVGVATETVADDDDDMEGLEFEPVGEVTPPTEGDVMVVELEVSYDLGKESDTYAPPDTFLLRFTNDGYEIFTDEHYLRTSPTELFEVFKPELEAGP